MLGRDPSRGLSLLAREVIGCDNKGSHSPVCLCSEILAAAIAWSSLERNFIIPQTLGLSAAAQSLANPAGSSGTFFVYEKHISVQSFTVLNGSSFREVPLSFCKRIGGLDH